MKRIIVACLISASSIAHANLPLPQVVTNAGQGGGVVSTMRGMNSHSSEMPQNQMMQQQAMDQTTQQQTAAEAYIMQIIEEKISYTLEHNAVGHSSYWREPVSGNKLIITPTKNFPYKDNKYCRQYRIIIQTQNEETKTNNVACRLADKQWARID